MNTDENFEITIPFPPKITVQDLIPIRTAKNPDPKVPNSFIAYRIEVVRELKSRNIVLGQSKTSTLASMLWGNEPEEVKKHYRDMSKLATIQYNQATGGLTFISNSHTMPIIPTQDDSTLITSPLRRTGSTSSSASLASFQLFDQFSGSNFLGRNSLTSSPSLQGNQPLYFPTSTGKFCMSPAAMTKSQFNDTNEQRIQQNLQVFNQRVQDIEALNHVLNQRVQGLEALNQVLNQRVQDLEQCLQGSEQRLQNLELFYLYNLPPV